MKVLEIWAENVRGISTKKVVNPAPTGVTLIHAPNESGKTTLSEVLTFLFTWPSDSKHATLKNLQPVGKDVGPSMGATIEIGPDTYTIRKQWLKEKKTEVEVTGSRTLQLAGPDAQVEIERIFRESLDSTFWELLQLQQAEFNALVVNEFGSDFLKDLQNLLDKISTDTEEESADTLFEKVNSEHKKWFAAKGGPTTAAGTQGRVLSDLLDEIEKLKDIKQDLQRQISESAKIEQAVKVDRVDVEFLKAAFQAQDLNRKITPLIAKEANYQSLIKAVDDALKANPILKTFSIEKFAKLQKLYPLELKFSALNLLTLKSLQENVIQIQGEAKSLSKNETQEVALEPGLKIEIPGILEITYGSASEDAPNLGTAHSEFQALLVDMGLNTWTEAEELSREFSALTSKREQLASLEELQSLESIREELKALQNQAGLFPNWEELIASPQVDFKDLDRLSNQDAFAQGRWIEINKNGWDQKLNETISLIQSAESQIKRLKLQRDAIKKLYETLIEQREKSAKHVAPIFAEKLNELAKAFFGEGVDFHVDDEFSIQSRYKDGSSVPITSLSTGAKEQLAILIRLTLSRLVQLGNEDNLSVPVIFDDEFGHTDPVRLKEMATLIKNMKEQQFIFMTCYPDKFNDFEIAKKIDLLA
jgi:hypothetical protein